ncbi:MAG: YtxH domain-containing protein [Paludibacteraceae bacterium]|nr:YtxH domain-containing protein [Paludibacteraceae bacterium]
MRNLLSLLGGIAIGAIVALLLAPQSGEATRKQISDMVKEKLPNLTAEDVERYVDEILARIRKDKPEPEVATEAEA